MGIQRFFLAEPYDCKKINELLKDIQHVEATIKDLKVEVCYHIEVSKNGKLERKTETILRWLLKSVQEEDKLKTTSNFSKVNNNELLIEIGPRFNFSTPFSTNCVNICENIGLHEIRRLEKSIRYLIIFQSAVKLESVEKLIDHLSDRMTECLYTEQNMPKESFDECLPKIHESWYTIPVLKNGRKALEEINAKLGLAFGEWDLEFYTNLFKNVLKRDPTSVELFDCAQSNSEHSRHWFFRGKMIIDNEVQPSSLIKMIIDTQNTTNPNNTIKFSDNSSAIKGFRHKTLKTTSVIDPGPMELSEVDSDLIFTAETHNMPTAVSPFSGATTGTGGRIRDVEGIGRGGLCIAGTAGYCVGLLNIPGYNLPYENKNFSYPPSFAKPLKIIIEASNGASDYGNKFGEPVISGFAISYGVLNCMGDRDEYVKPIMFSGGLGTMNSTMRKKIDPSKGMLLAKIGGPVYRIGVGGGAASSVEVQGDNSSELDFNAVQRGDPEMENKVNRVVRACIEMGNRNPILAIHDQGAGGNGNVLKELVEPGFAGATIFSKEFQLGDPTITALELWGAEYQENNAILCNKEDRKLLQEICDRERCPISFVGIVNGNGHVTLVEQKADFENEKFLDRKFRSELGNLPFDLELKHVLGDMPKREYKLTKEIIKLTPFYLDETIKYNEIFERVLSVMAVGSKRFLTNKVDRCVTGLIAQQQCVGPFHTPLADYAITAVSHFTDKGIATSIGTQPIKGLLSAKSGARMSVAEAVSNLVFAGITELSDVKCSGNWMWAAKLPGEGAKMYEACVEMCSIMRDLNIAVDGGKDSLSMAARIDDRTIKSPGTLVISTYAPCPNIYVKVTPDLKAPSFSNADGELIWVHIERKFRIGGSAFAQAFNQQGQYYPDLENTAVLKNAFNVTQNLLKEGKILAGHDISDGGLFVCLCEMAIGGLCGLKIDMTNVIDKINLKNIYLEGLPSSYAEIVLLLAEECGWVMEISKDNFKEVTKVLEDNKIPAIHIGQSTGRGLDSPINILGKHKTILKTNLRTIFKQWERTSFELEKIQMDKDCAIEEYNTLNYRVGPSYFCSFNPNIDEALLSNCKNIKVAVLREEGINSDREMMATLINSKFEVHDVCMHDLLTRKTYLDRYHGIIFPGGFSYADTLGSAKGWAANIMYSDIICPQFEHFRKNPKSFSLGICNGCQLMGLIGWIGNENENAKERNIVDVPDVALLHNNSRRFECRWSTVKITKNNSIMMKNMEESVLGCWVAHGEGKFSFKNQKVLEDLKSNQCIVMNYVDDNGDSTEVYPMNPNGSPEGIAGICSKDGRHLALMPHPERCTLMFQWPYKSPGFNPKRSPWQKMFDNAYVWCCENN
ncbi:phosphoribosylformylglycinamidine synthase [Condylostylus longicornis]|uniref:phosphoribosylformylglycinamidine synthase n=1 Tax=Condylostylus longicornis TaxID=2530218 RepID=UPI00244DCC6B|nr:phosphoribosylformylglycinamidine synthase [Condylostylus longicornis]